MSSKDENGGSMLERTREKAIRDLLLLCAEREVEIPEEMRAALLGEQIAKAEADKKKEPILELLISERSAELAAESSMMQDIHEMIRNTKMPPLGFELRIVDGSYTVTNRYEVAADGSRKKMDTVFNVSPLGSTLIKLKRLFTTGNVRKKSETKVIMDRVNLRIQPGKMYLVLGAPGSGKSTLLKLLANTLYRSKDRVVGGTLSINGVSPDDKDVYWTNLVAYIDQIDRLHAYLTVFETFKFAWECRSGGSHAMPLLAMDDPEVQKTIAKMDEDLFTVNTVMRGLAIDRVRDTFVGDNTNVRGVSGGERKRVTVGEIVCSRAPFLCCDEISTGLDSATTYDIVKLLKGVSTITGTTKIVSLLQPPPETVALFDEVILVDSGRIIYNGPVEDVIGYFESLGYKIPERMDVADWLVSLGTPDGKDYLVAEDGSVPSHLSSEEFRTKFESSSLGTQVQEAVNSPFPSEQTESVLTLSKGRYKNSWYRSLKLVTSRELLLWWRDKYQIQARVAQDLIMGIVAGTVFWQTDNPQSIMGISFQSMFFIFIGAMLKVPGQFPMRSIFYKQQDANFFQTWTYVFGRSLAGFPTSIIDGLVYGTIVYWFVGLAFNDGASIANYFVFMLLVLTASLAGGLVFSIFSATVKDQSTAQACMSLTVVFLVLFSGFTVQPDVIPNYWIWAYWINLFAWILRGIVVNEFQSGKYDVDAGTGNGLTVGENILTQFGFTLDGEPFGYEWVWYGLLFTLGVGFISVFISVLFLSIWRFETGKSLDVRDSDEVEIDDNVAVEIPFQRVDLTFKDIHYTVKASTKDETLELLKGIDGYVEAGRMTALMGSSGAGKTTLMDCLALRKTSGEISGEVCLNGHLQEPNSFRRCTGYVEQFDEQTAELTIRETVEFSAKLRLDENDPAVTPESIQIFIDQTLDMLELRAIENLQVGTDLTGGLSFEQKKRLSIAVELVANPSILFLDEPTSGLDARAAGIVMRGLKRIAFTGRAVCATIHQPSIAIFNSFDNLLLLKRGGETVYFGELGNESSRLIEYLERYDATDKIQPGENPATWMLKCIGAGGSSGNKVFDYASSYAASKLHEDNLKRIEEICSGANDDNLVAFSSKYATSRKTQKIKVLLRAMKIYWRAPTYNLARLLVSVIVALLFGSVYASQRTPENEGDMNSRVTSIFITALFLAVTSYNTVLGVFENIRNMYYRHKAALMYDQRAIILAFTIAEIPFILLSSMLFCVCFYFLVGFSTEAYKFFLYYLFFTLNMGCFTFMGQMFMSLARDSVTAQGFGGLIISMTSLFSGILIRPQNITGFWLFAYWLFPGHYVIEGLIATQFHNDDTPIEASTGSPFYFSLGCNEKPDQECIGTAEGWVEVSFGGKFQFENWWKNFLYLFGLAVATRIITFFALTKLNYLAK